VSNTKRRNLLSLFLAFLLLVRLLPMSAFASNDITVLEEEPVTIEETEPETEEAIIAEEDTEPAMSLAASARASSLCSKCGTLYTYSIVYQTYTSTKHKVIHKCGVCSKDQNSSTKTESHSLSYGSWSNYSATQHRRTEKCSKCGYNTYDYATHSLYYGDWTESSDTEHTTTAECSVCTYSGEVTADHDFSYGDWMKYSDTEHYRTCTCSTCGYSGEEYAEHTDDDGDELCDDCGAYLGEEMFSVTVPTAMTLVVSQWGEVYAADNVEIVNNSTDDVVVTGIEITGEKGWTIVPYSCNMAKEKVDSKLIGFSINDAQSSVTGRNETLALTNTWTVALDGALALEYDAVVSATSTEIMDAYVLTVTFVIDWA